MKRCQRAAISSGDAVGPRSSASPRSHQLAEKRPPAAFSTAPDVVQAADARKATPGATRSASSSGAWRRSTRVAATGDMALTRMSVSANSAASPTIRPTCAILAVE